jgi:DNA-binding transcriptional ArsR family regulator
MDMHMLTAEEFTSKPFDLQIQVFKVLTLPSRLAILEILRDGEHCVCHLETYLGYRQAYISQQLAVLRDSGLVTDRRDGWNIFYRVADERIYEILDAVRRFTSQSDLELKKPNVPCTCPQCSSLTC